MSHHMYADETQMFAKATLQSLGACCRELVFRRLESALTSMMSTSSLSTVYVTLAYTWSLGRQTQYGFPHQQDRLDLLFSSKTTASSALYG